MALHDPAAPEPNGAPSLATAAAESDGDRRAHDSRRRLDRGGRRRVDWPEDAGLTGCPGCGHEALQSLGALDSGEYLWQCPGCDRRFTTSRAQRCML